MAIQRKLLVKSYLLAALGLMLSNTAYAEGLNSNGDQLPIGAGGQTVLTINSNLSSSFAGPVTFNGILNAPLGVNVNNLTFLNPDGTSTFNNTTTVNGATNLRSATEIGTEGLGSFMPVGTSEVGPILSIGGATTNNTDPIYFQRFNENYDTTSLHLVIGDNSGSPYTPGAPGTYSNGDAFIIGALNSADSSYAWVPHFTFTSDGKLGVGTTTPQATLDVQGEVKVGLTGVACTEANAGAVRFNTSINVLEACNGSAWTNVTGGAYSAGGIDVVYEDNVGAFAYCRLPWGAATGCDQNGNVTCTRGTPHVTSLAHDLLSYAEIPSNSRVNSSDMVSQGGQVNHTDCIVQ